MAFADSDADSERGWLAGGSSHGRAWLGTRGWLFEIHTGREAEIPKSRSDAHQGQRCLGRRLLETLLNDVRREAELPPLEFDGLLEEIASKKVKVLAKAGAFGHRLRGHSSPQHTACGGGYCLFACCRNHRRWLQCRALVRAVACVAGPSRKNSRSNPPASWLRTHETVKGSPDFYRCALIDRRIGLSP